MPKCDFNKVALQPICNQCDKNVNTLIRMMCVKCLEETLEEKHI